MKSRTYSNNTFHSKNKGQLWIPIFLAIGFFFAFPVAELIQMGNWAGYGYTAEEMARSFEHMWKSGLLTSGALVSFAAAFINGINGFWYLYSSSKVDFYHCLPVKRSRMFLEKAVFGLLYFIIPYVVMEFFAVCLGAMRGYFSLSFMGMAVKMLLAHLAMYLMAYFCVVLAITLTGNLLMGALMTAAIFLYAPIAGVIREGVKGSFFQTFTVYSHYHGSFIQEMWKLYFSPVSLSSILVNDYSAGEGFWMNLSFILLFALTAAVASFFAYTRRSMEAAGKSMVYRFVGVLVEFMVVIPAGIGFGQILRSLAGKESKDFWWMLGLILGTILAHGMLQVVYHLDFRRFFSARVQFLIASVCVTACALTLRFDLLGFDTYMPKFENLKAMEINVAELSGRERMNNRRVTEKNGKYQIEELRCDLGSGREEYDLLKAIVEKQDSYSEESYNGASVQVSYTNKFGFKADRRYKITAEETGEILKAAYETGNLKKEKYSYLEISTDYLREVLGAFADGEGFMLFQGDVRKKKELMEALKQDVAEADTETLLGIPVSCLEFEYEIPLTDGTDIRYWAVAYVFPEYKRTLAILNETGYSLSIEDMEIESAKYGVKIHTGNGYFTAEGGQVTDVAQLKELKKAMVPYYFDAEWIEIDDRAEVNVTLKGRDQTVSMLLLKDRIPQFAEEEIMRIMKTEGKNLATLSTKGMDLHKGVTSACAEIYRQKRQGTCFVKRISSAVIVEMFMGIENRKMMW